MACKKCASSPKFPKGRCRVFISIDIDKLFLKIKSLVENNYTILKSSSTHFEIEVEDFEKSMFIFTKSNEVSLKEASGISVLPLYQGEVLDFPTFARTKTLDKWISLFKSRDLIYILEKETLVSYFQPIVDIKDNSIYGYELLSRGIKEDGSIMPPYEMFKLARESDLLFNLDRQARETAIVSSAREGLDKKLFINFLPTVIYNPEVCLRTTINLINKFNFKSENVIFEVVETEDIKDSNHLNSILDFYRNKGFKIALDDVGSGYSSLNNLSKFYPDYIKIDLEIIRNIDKNKLQQEIFKALVAMAENTNIKVLAEGVETREELEFVVAQGADLVQGYLFGRPLPKPLKKIGSK